MAHARICMVNESIMCCMCVGASTVLQKEWGSLMTGGKPISALGKMVMGLACLVFFKPKSHRLGLCIVKKTSCR